MSLLLLPQRYVFSSKSQLNVGILILLTCCYCYHKGTYFQANHNYFLRMVANMTLLLLPQRYVFSSKSQPPLRIALTVRVVIATTKVRIFKQITTLRHSLSNFLKLLLLPQRYVFSSKSQPGQPLGSRGGSCYCYHKGTYFQANHNFLLDRVCSGLVVIATTKVRIFKQITTYFFV